MNRGKLARTPEANKLPTKLKQKKIEKKKFQGSSNSTIKYGEHLECEPETVNYSKHLHILIQ